jgi:hypothetical protein
MKDLGVVQIIIGKQIPYIQDEINSEIRSRHNSLSCVNFSCITSNLKPQWGCPNLKLKYRKTQIKD